MRTLELPDDVFERIERAAAARGLSPAEYLGQREAPEEPPKPTGKRVRFPIFECADPSAPKITKAMIEQAELEDDLRRSGLLR